MLAFALSPRYITTAMSEPIVSPLYDDPDADVVLRSCDNVDFRLDKRTLRRQSTVFRDMFTLPDEPSQGHEPQIVAVTESAATLEDLLPFIYLVGGRPEVLELSRLRAVLTAADKYDLAVLDDTLQNNLRLHIPAEPLRVYAVAYMREDAELAQAAARCLLAHPQFSVPADPPPEYHEIPAIAIWQVHMYRQRCVLAALEIFRSEEHIISPPRAGHAISVSRKGNADTSGAWVWLACTSCDAGWLSLAVSNSATGRRDTVRPRAWWQKYFDAVVRQLALRPLGFVASDSKLLRETVAEAAKCTTCGPRGALQVYEYAEAMARRIDEATSKVRGRACVPHGGLRADCRRHADFDRTSISNSPELGGDHRPGRAA